MPKKISNGNIDLLQWLRKKWSAISDKIFFYKQSTPPPPHLPNSGLPFVSIKNDGFYLNDIKIIDKKAELQMAIFKILIDLHIEEFYTGTIKYISISKIDSLLRTQGFDLEDPEKQIRRAIYLIRTSVKLTGIGTKMDSLIESEKWKGYRISDHIFLRKF